MVPLVTVGVCTCTMVTVKKRVFENVFYLVFSYTNGRSSYYMWCCAIRRENYCYTRVYLRYIYIWVIITTTIMHNKCLSFWQFLIFLIYRYICNSCRDDDLDGRMFLLFFFYVFIFWSAHARNTILSPNRKFKIYASKNPKFFYFHFFYRFYWNNL